MAALGTSNVDQVCEQFAALLARTEWRARGELQAYRNGLLERLVSFAFAHSPFYRDRLAVLFRNGSKPDLAHWSQVPILTRNDLEGEIDRINPASVPEEQGPVLEVHTSGTTGKPFSFKNSLLALLGAECMMNRLFRWRGFDLSAPLASIRTYRSGERCYPEGVSESRWSFPGPSAPHYSIEVHTPIADLIEWLARRRPRYLLTFPSIAHELALHPDAGRVAEIGLKHILAISEIVPPDIRSTVRDRFGCEMAQFYGCAEIGCIAVQSPLDETCLVCEETVLVEILDEEGQPAAPGQPGRVVLTGLYNYATPFIRYAIGDYATLAPEPCPSGRTLTRLLRVEGRHRNALRSAQGRLIWPSAVVTADLLARIPDTPFQIRQPNIDRLELLLVRASGRNEPDHSGLREHFSVLLGLSIDLRITAVDHIPRSAAGKFERTISTVPA